MEVVYQLQYRLHQVQVSYMQQLRCQRSSEALPRFRQLVASPVCVQQLVLVILISIDRSYDVGVHAVLMCIGGQCLIAVVCRCA